MNIYLTDTEIVKITGRRRPSTQLEWLRSNGFTALQRADRRVLVSRRNFERVMGGLPVERAVAETEPDFSEFD